MLDAARQEWHCFRDDRPGKRFANHHERAHQSSKAKRVARVGIGVLLLAAGVAMLFLPGPGLLGILFGVALFAGESGRLATLLDRGEVRARGWWKHASTPARAAVIGVAALAAAAVVGLMVKKFFF